MLRSFFVLTLFLTLPTQAFALAVQQIDCQDSAPANAVCKIALQGVVQAGDSLLVPRVEDIDILYFNGARIGSTGNFAGRNFYAAYVPRVYPLDVLVGKDSPVLEMHIQSVFSKKPGIPGTARIISANTPLSKILIGPLALFFEFLLLSSLSVFVLIWLWRGVVDGWSYPQQELRAFGVATFLFLLFQTEFLRSSAPGIIPKDLFLFLASLSTMVMMWSITNLLLEGRFSDRSCVERGLGKKTPVQFYAYSNFSLIVGLLVCSSRPHNSLPFVLLSLACFASVYAAIQNMEWKRVWKRSSLGSLFFNLSLVMMGIGLPLVEIVKIWNENASQGMGKSFAAICLFTAAWRVLKYQSALQRSLKFVEECRVRLATHYKGEERLQAFSEMVEAEWGFARVSLICVQEGQGLVLACAGPDAIPAQNRTLPQKLGPFLRRVCKEAHMLYAPVAEELGKELQEKGLKHSSLGIPLLQENKVVAVLCVMADEDQRIPPYDAMMIDIAVQTIRLEIVSAVLQSVAEERNDRVLSVARVTGGLVIEHIDTWGRLHLPKEPQQRILVAAEIQANDALLEEAAHSPLLAKVLQTYHSELRSIWFALRSQFEFLSKDIRSDDFWAASPGEFRNQTLRELGDANVALVLAHLLEKHARQLCLREDFTALGISGAKVAVSPAQLRFIPLGKHDVYGMDIDPGDVNRIEKIRELAKPSEILSAGIDTNPSSRAFHAKFCQREWEKIDLKIFSVLSIAIDKKELRKLEFNAIEQAKDLVQRKKAAA